MPAFIIIYKAIHVHRFIKTAQLWDIFYKPAQARLCIKATEAVEQNAPHLFFLKKL
jgi:hypothetical protein